ncbi:MAG: hypothetical protein VB055_03635 [Oscillospiraceae bacterium]|nr:hypothetical protein [Oscillospiraceae bacterium]
MLIGMYFYHSKLGGGLWLNSSDWSLDANSGGNACQAMNYPILGEKAS